MITNIKQLIIAHAKEIGIKFDSKGYVASPGKNLILNFPNWNVIQVEIKNGKGNELKTYKKKCKTSFYFNIYYLLNDIIVIRR